jgi:hypothetical protein
MDLRLLAINNEAFALIEDYFTQNTTTGSYSVYKFISEMRIILCLTGLCRLKNG